MAENRQKMNCKRQRAISKNRGLGGGAHVFNVVVLVQPDFHSGGGLIWWDEEDGP